MISSVAPDLNELMSTVVKTSFGKTPVIVRPSIYEKLKIDLMNPCQIGSDWVPNLTLNGLLEIGHAPHKLEKMISPSL